MVQDLTLCPRRRNHPASGDYNSAGYGGLGADEHPRPSAPQGAAKR